MPRFPIRWQIQFDGRNVARFQLTEEVSLQCEIRGNSFSVELCRKSTTGVFTLSGELTLSPTHMLSTKKFSVLIEKGSPFVLICSYPVTYLGIYSTRQYLLEGFVNISYTNEKSTTEISKEERKKGILMTSLVELSNNFERLLDPKTSCFADVILKCGGASIPAHKNILSARSPVFAAMFSNPMKESQQNEVDVVDMDVSVVRAMLTYVYTGQCTDLTDQSASNLLFAADKYQLPDLKRVCCGYLKAAVSLQNVLRILVLGDLHDEDLKSFAVDYVCNKCPNFSVLEKTEEWTTLRRERPALAMDILTSLVKSRDGKQGR